MKVIKTILLTLILSFFVIPSVAAETPQASPCPSSEGGFGCFEVGLPGITEQTIDSFLDHNSNRPILAFIDFAVKAVIAILVIIGVISIVVGGYLYMTAAGNAKQIGTAKEMILAALVGIFLSLVSVVILNTVNTFLGSSAKDPIELMKQLGGQDGKSPASNAPQQDSNAGNLPTSNTVTFEGVNNQLRSTEGVINDFFAGRGSFDTRARDDLQTTLTTLRGQISRLPNQNSTEVTQLLADHAVLQEKLNELSRVFLP